MTLDFISQGGSRRLILFFAGWSATPALFSGLKLDGWDMAVVSGDDLTPPDWTPLRDYHTTYLYAWSMGVYFAARLLPEEFSPAACFAINGTETPCHDLTGIPEAIFRGTAEGLTPRSLEKFRIRMCGSTQRYRETADMLQGGDTQRLADQLRAVADDSNPPRRFTWRAAYVSERDRIFPAENQTRAWREKTELRYLSDDHLPDFQKILRHTVIDVQRVGDRFSRSLDTYTQHAHAQRMIAERLASLFALRSASQLDDVLEIGCGTGLFTFSWSKLVSTHHATFMDLCDMPDFSVANEEKYVKGDAEAHVARMAGEGGAQFDAILSASAIQWFSNPRKFLADCVKLLRPGGVIAISTFAPGNLPELLHLRRDPMYYPAAEALRSYLPADWEVEMIEEDVEIDFTTPLDALRHLRLTGVTGSSATATPADIRRFAANYPVNPRGRYSLTFKPIYLLAHPRR